MIFGISNDESQRDSGLKPRVARNELPWENKSHINNPNGVVARQTVSSWCNPVGVEIYWPDTQGSSFLATLGSVTQSRWDCRNGRSTRPATKRFIRLEFRTIIKSEMAAKEKT